MSKQLADIGTARRKYQDICLGIALTLIERLQWRNQTLVDRNQIKRHQFYSGTRLKAALL
ncbi:MAG: hypothetical protein ACFE0J_01025 [Elainellaceae cyanobacterium]